MTDNNSNRVLLTNMVVIRPILIVLLVLYHSFAIYSGAWEPIDGFPKIQIYWWLDKLWYAFMLEAFVFISGYVFGYQVRIKGDVKLKFLNLISGKLTRLIMPCAIFSLLYILLFGDICQPICKTLYGLVKGVGHMWFLPMLFWCFVAIWIIEKIRISPKVALPLCILASLIAVNGKPLQLSHTMYYMTFFYMGYALQRYDFACGKYYTKHAAFFSIVFFITFFVCGTLICRRLDSIFSNQQLAIQAMKFILGKAIMLTYSGAGIVMLMIVVGYVQKGKTKDVPRCLVEIGNCCFGVYLLQQFILHALYYNSSLPSMIGPIWLPWMGFIITLIISLLISWLLRQTKVGKKII